MNKQMKEYIEKVNFINLWLKGTWFINILILICSFILLNINPNISLIPTILLIGSTSLASIYMLFIKISTKRKIKKVKYMIEREEKLKSINIQKSIISSKKTIKNNTEIITKDSYYYKDKTVNSNYNKTNSKIKKRIFPN